MTMQETAREFFDACDTGKGWEVCSRYCTPDASFSAQADPLAGVDTVEGYTDWMKGLFTPVPNGSYELKSLAVDEARGNVCVFAVFSGTHTDDGGPVPPTGRSITTEYVYVMEFDGDKIAHVTKVWNCGVALRELGWA